MMIKQNKVDRMEKNIVAYCKVQQDISIKEIKKAPPQ
jgi:hypothetical protein